MIFSSAGKRQSLFQGWYTALLLNHPTTEYAQSQEMFHDSVQFSAGFVKSSLSLLSSLSMVPADKRMFDNVSEG